MAPRRLLDGIHSVRQALRHEPAHPLLLCSRRSLQPGVRRFLSEGLGLDRCLPSKLSLHASSLSHAVSLLQCLCLGLGLHMCSPALSLARSVTSRTVSFIVASCSYRSVASPLNASLWNSPHLLGATFLHSSRSCIPQCPRDQTLQVLAFFQALPLHQPLRSVSGVCSAVCVAGESVHHVMQLSCPVHVLRWCMHLLFGSCALSVCSHDSLPAWSAWVSACSGQRSATTSAVGPISGTHHATHHHLARGGPSPSTCTFAEVLNCSQGVRRFPNASVCSVGARAVRFSALDCGMLDNHLHAVSLSKVPVGATAVSQVARVRVRVLSRTTRLHHPNTSATPPPTHDHFAHSLRFAHQSLFSRHVTGRGQNTHLLVFKNKNTLLHVAREHLRV